MMKPRISIGHMRERVQIQRVTNTRDVMGGLIETWTTIYTAFAMVDPISASEQYRRQQIQAAAEWEITIRFNNDIRPTDRVIWRDRTFQITGVLNQDMRRQYLTMSCHETSVAPTTVTAYP